MTFKIKVDGETCIGCGACIECDNFYLEEDKAHVKNPEPTEDIQANKDAEEMCPVMAISYEESK